LLTQQKKRQKHTRITSRQNKANYIYKLQANYIIINYTIIIIIRKK